MTVKELLDLHPEFHLDERGKSISWAIGRDVLEYLDQVVGPESRTMETGAGLSTLVMALNGCSHLAITPAGGELQRIRDFCRQHQVDLAKVRLLEERSEIALPRVEDRDLDLFLVDGRHAFPSPFIDWFYGAEYLKLGGLMVVDDTQLWTGRVLHDFLEAETHWRTVESLGKTTIFQKLDLEIHTGEWNSQPFILQQQAKSS